MGSNFGDFDYEILIQTSDWKNKNDTADQLNWCVGVAVNKKKILLDSKHVQSWQRTNLPSQY
jgi:hypothetical protein